MGRTDDDSWEITESVGATALGVAAARAAETQSENPLISDRFARVFLDAAGEGMWSWFAAPNLPAQLPAAEPDLKPRMQAMVDYMAARTALFDTFFLDAAGAGVRQVVILAAGPDVLDQAAREKQREATRRLRDLMAEAEPDREVPDLADLWYFEEREDVGDWLGRHGWEVTATAAEELMAGYGRTPPQGIEDATPRTLFVTAQRRGTDAG